MLKREKAITTSAKKGFLVFVRSASDAVGGAPLATIALWTVDGERATEASGLRLRSTAVQSG